MEGLESTTIQVETDRHVLLTEHRIIDMLDHHIVAYGTIHGPTHHRRDAPIIGRIIRVGIAIPIIDISTLRP